MSHASQQNQVTSGNETQLIYQYRLFSTNGTGLCTSNTFKSQCNKVLSQNQNLLVLGDENFTRISINGNSYGSNQYLNKPKLIVFCLLKYHQTLII